MRVWTRTRRASPPRTATREFWIAQFTGPPNGAARRYCTNSPGTNPISRSREAMPSNPSMRTISARCPGLSWSRVVVTVIALANENQSQQAKAVSLRPPRKSRARPDERRVARGERREASGERREARGERRVARGEWREARGERRVASGEWRVASGEWRVASGEWRVASGEWWIAAFLATRFSPLATKEKKAGRASTRCASGL
mgnify:CR=1 FL=1